MSNFFRRAGAALVLGVMLGCTTRLDINPAFDIPVDQALTDNNALQNSLQSAFAALGSKYTLGGNLRAWPDVMSDVVVLNPASPHVPGEIDIYNRRLSPNDTTIARTWLESYRAINRANEIIYAVRNSGKFDTSNVTTAQIYHQAYFIRGVMYFELARWFGPQFSDATLGQPCVPLRTLPTREQEFTATATVEQVYAQIESDLRKAAYGGALPLREETITTQYGMATAGAAKGMLARLYFQQGTPSSYAKCLAMIDELVGDTYLGPNNTVPTMAEVNNRTQNTNTTVFYPNNFPLLKNAGRNMSSLYAQVGRGVPQRTIGGDVYYETLFQVLNSEYYATSSELTYRYSFRPSIPDYTSPRYVPAPSFVNSPNNQNGDNATLLWRFDQDNRYADLFRDNISLGQGQPVSVDGVNVFPSNKYAYGAAPTESVDRRVNIPYLRVAELLLDRAEILAQRGDTLSLVKAATELIMLKGRARVLSNSPGQAQRLHNPTSINTLAKSGNFDIIRKEIELERLRELCFEGDRLHDLRRRGLDVPASTNRPGWNLPKDRGILPIPATETRTNPKL